MFPLLHRKAFDPSAALVVEDGVSVERVQANGMVWRCVKVIRLPPEINGGRHNIFIDLIDVVGIPTRRKISWTWEGRTADQDAPSPALDKQDPSEPMGDIAIYAGQNIRLWVDDGRPSDAVSGLRSDLHLPNHDYGHISYYVVFQCINASEDVVKVPVSETGIDQAAVRDLVMRARSLVNQLNEVLIDLSAITK